MVIFFEHVTWRHSIYGRWAEKLRLLIRAIEYLVDYYGIKGVNRLKSILRRFYFQNVGLITYMREIYQYPFCVKRTKSSESNTFAHMHHLKCVVDKKSSKVFYVPLYFKAIWISRSAHSSHSFHPEKAEFWKVNKFKLRREGGGHRIFWRLL